MNNRRRPRPDMGAAVADEGLKPMNIVDRIGQKQMKKSLEQRTIPDFAPGDTVRVDVKVVEGSRERIQVFEGVCIGRKSDGCLLYTSPSPRDKRQSRMPSSA